MHAQLRLRPAPAPFKKAFPASKRVASAHANLDRSSSRTPSSSSPCHSAVESVKRIATQNAVVVFSTSDCCMTHVAKRLLCSLGVNPTVVELEGEPQDGEGAAMEGALRKLAGGDGGLFPVVFIGGEVLGGVDRLMAAHISGSLIPRLKEAGALWL